MEAFDVYHLISVKRREVDRFVDPVPQFFQMGKRDLPEFHVSSHKTAELQYSVAEHVIVALPGEVVQIRHRG
jgi:hypothetical protein